MSKYWNGESKAALWLLVGIFLLGMALGAVFANIAFPYSTSEVQVIGIYAVEQLKNRKISGREYMWYLLEERFTPFFVFVLGGMTSMARPLAICVMIALGFLAGAMGSMTILQYGMKGLGVFISSNMPQAFLLGPALLFLMTGIYQLNGRIWRKPASVIKRYLLLVFLSGLGYFFGVVLECFVNPALVSRILF